MHIVLWTLHLYAAYKHNRATMFYDCSDIYFQGMIKRSQYTVSADVIFLRHMLCGMCSCVCTLACLCV